MQRVLILPPARERDDRKTFCHPSGCACPRDAVSGGIVASSSTPGYRRPTLRVGFWPQKSRRLTKNRNPSFYGRRFTKPRGRGNSAKYSNAIGVPGFPLFFRVGTGFELHRQGLVSFTGRQKR